MRIPASLKMPLACLMCAAILAIGLYGLDSSSHHEFCEQQEPIDLSRQGGNGSGPKPPPGCFEYSDSQEVIKGNDGEGYELPESKGGFGFPPAPPRPDEKILNDTNNTNATDVSNDLIDEGKSAKTKQQQ